MFHFIIYKYNNMKGSDEYMYYGYPGYGCGGYGYGSSGLWIIIIVLIIFFILFWGNNNCNQGHGHHGCN